MKRFKKLLSVILAVIMLLSTVSVSFVSFAAGGEKSQAKFGVNFFDEVVSWFEKVADDVSAVADNQKKKNNANAITTVETNKFNSTSPSVGKTDKVKAFEEKVNSFEGNLTVATPTSEDLEGYEAIITAYKALTLDEKKAVDVSSFDVMLRRIYDREKVLIKASNPSMSTKDIAIQAHKNVDVVLGEQPWFFQAAIDLYTVLKANATTGTQALAAYAAADEYARAYSSLWYPSQSHFYYNFSAYGYYAYSWIMPKVQKELLAKDPLPGGGPAYAGFPDASDTTEYPMGKEDDKYKADYALYVAYQDYQYSRNNHNAKINRQAAEKCAAIAPEFMVLLNSYDEFLAALDLYNADNKNTAPAFEAAKKLNANYVAKNIFANYSSGYLKANRIVEADGSIEVFSYVYFKTLYSEIFNIVEYEKVVDFQAYIATVKKPYTNQTIKAVKDAFAKVPKSLQSKVPAETMDIYKAVLASVVAEPPSELFPDLRVYKKAKVSYPTTLRKSRVANSIDPMQDLLLMLVDQFAAPQLGVPANKTTMNYLRESLFTNATIDMIVKQVYPFLANLDLSSIGDFASTIKELISVSPADLAKHLHEEKFANARAKMSAVTIDPKDKTASWANVAAFESGDFGFQDGDMDGFINALVSLVRPVVIVLALLGLPNNIDLDKGTYGFALYEDIIPVFETLGLEGVISSDAYSRNLTKAVADAKASVPAGSTQEQIDIITNATLNDNLLKPLLTPIFNLVDDFLNDPIITLLDKLPIICYALDSGILDKQLHVVTSQGLLSSLPLQYSLTPEFVYNILINPDENVNGLLENIPINDTKTITIMLNKDKFMSAFSTLAHCANPEIADSVSGYNLYRIGLTTDQADTFVVLFRWLYTEISSKQNVKTIKTVIDSLDMTSFEKFMLKSTVGTITLMPANLALTTFINFVNPLGWIK